ncbi:hypothetical protein N9S30_00305, partial [bacterium]|nr:hypothetical protein [bacterium]
ATVEEVENDVVFRATTVVRSRFEQGDLFRGDVLRVLDGGVVRIDPDGEGCEWLTELSRETAREETHEELKENPEELHKLSEANEVSDAALLCELVSALTDDICPPHAKHMADWVRVVVEEEGDVVDGGEEGFRALFPKVPLVIVVEI